MGHRTDLDLCINGRKVRGLAADSSAVLLLYTLPASENDCLRTFFL